MPNGPIPGENYTSDTKNYPWHQPPQYTDISDALDKVATRITDPKITRGFIALAEVGVPLYRLSGMIIMQGVSNGLWTVDLGLLMVGPTTKMLEIICDTMGIEYKIGIEEEEDTMPTGAFFKAKAERAQRIKSGSPIPILKQEMPAIKAEAETQDPQGKTEDIQDVGFAKMKQGA